MALNLVERLEKLREKKKLSILAMCRWINTSNENYHRWKKAKNINGPYEKIIEDFLEKNETRNPSTSKLSPAALENAGLKSSDIAVIGIGCYYPGAANVRELWENIVSRRVQFRRMLDQRLPLSEYYNEDPKFPDTTFLTKAAFLENFQFDWGKLRIPKKTVESTDIAHWLALDIALKTFEDAGYKLSEIPLQNTGVIVGNTLTGEQTRSQTLRLRWPFVKKALNATLGHRGMSLEDRSSIALEMEQIYKSAFYPVTEDSLAGGLANTIAGRICNYLNLKGGGYIVDGACSSSLLAVATAADALKMGNMDLALAGGVDISLDPFELVGFAKAGALAKDQMRVYDQRAAGFLPGEGCGFVLLKRLNDAIRDKNYVYATIKGWGISSDGKGGIMEPSSSGQSFAIGRAYKDLPYKISDVDFVEGHGTGTTKGDKVELEGISSAIEKSLNKGHKDKHSCGVTSFKSIVGHTKAAAGVGGLIKAVLAVNQRVLPPTASCTEPNEVFQDKAKFLYPIIQGGFLDGTKVARAGISSAGFGGINCHITIESKDKAKESLKSKIDERALFVSQQQTEVFVFSSRTTLHLKKIIQRFKEDLRNISIAEMADLAALLNKKTHKRFPIRVAIVADSPEHLYEALVLLEQEIDVVQLKEGQIHKVTTKAPNTYLVLSNAAKKSRIGFLYPGQGSQRLNMARVLVERFSWARDMLSISKIPLYDHIYKATDKFITKEDQQEFDKQLTDTRITQPAIILSSLIWSEFLSRLGVEPECVAGHSLGELIAFYKAGAFNKETLIKFAELRGSLMAQKGPGNAGMASLICSKQKAESLISKIQGNIIIANINSPSQTVISGGIKEIGKALELASKEEISARRLNVSNAFHSSFMKEASDKIKATKTLPGSYSPNSVEVYSGMAGALLDKKVELREYFSKQVVSPVNFVGAIEAISKDCDVLVEVGPGRVLTDLAKAINKDEGPLCLAIESMPQSDRDLNTVLAELYVRNVPIRWEELYRNRMIREFVPVSKKRFIENQCEHPLKLGNQVLKTESLQFTGSSAVADEQPEEIIPGGLPAIDGKNDIANLLIELTHKFTGFEKSTITLDLKFSDDLHLDSINVTNLMVDATRMLGVAGKIDPSKVLNDSLSQVRDKLDLLVQSRGAGFGKETLTDVLSRYKDKGWVRNFIQKLIPQEIAIRNVNQLKGLKNIVLISDEEEDGQIETIMSGLKHFKIKTKKMRYNDQEEKVQISHANCLIAILPKDQKFNELNRNSLKEIIKRFNKIISLGNAERFEKDAFVVIVQFGGGNFGENSNLKDIASASAKSLASTLSLEIPTLKVRILDFDNNIPDKVISQKVIDELQTYERFEAVGYDSELTRKVVRYENSDLADYKKRDIAWTTKDVVLVTGGAKGITAQCALEFARSTKAQMVLVGRSPEPQNKKDDANEINQTLKQFKEEDLTASYYQCDITDEKNVIDVIKKIQEKHGKVTGFIHGASLNSIKHLWEMSTNDALKESLPKVIGAVNVCKALSGQPPKLISAITSIIGLTGMQGSGWYGLANEVLNLYLNQYKVLNPKTQVISIAYSIWDEVGMGAKLGSVEILAQRGIGAIPVEQGVKRFRSLIENDPGVQQVVVAARLAGLDTWKSQPVKTNKFRFVEQIEYVLAGVELIAQAHLNIKDDPYLLDHNWKGSLLFPFVFGLEAMSQAVAFVLGLDNFDCINVKDINLVRPISVQQETGTTIEIHAQILEREKNKSYKRIKVDIYSQDTSYEAPHFSAVFEIGQKPKVSETADSLFKEKAKEFVDLDPQTDLYGPILFQGRMFQCIKQIHQLHYDEKVKEGEVYLTSAYKEAAGEFLKKNSKFNNRFLIGDPFFIDSMLQSMQVMIPKDISLPRSIEEIEINFLIDKNSSEYLIHSSIKKTGIDYYRASATVKEDTLSIRIKNCNLKILENILNNPSANDLVDSTHRDQGIIDERVLGLSRQFGFQPPVLKCQFLPRLNKLNKNERHQVEVPLMVSTANGTVKKLNRSVDVKINNIDWLPSGKPVLKGSYLEDIGISLSHNNNFLLCVAGLGDQGCDIEVITERSKEDWKSIIGKKYHEVLEQIVFVLRDWSLSGTAVWSTIEVLKKINQESSDIKIDHIKEEAIVLKVVKSENGYILITPLKLTNLKRRVVAFYQEGLTLDENQAAMNSDSSKTLLLKKFGFNEDDFGIQVDYSGPQEQYVFSKQFPVTFKTNKLLSKRVYFSNYFDWMGELREYSILPIMDTLSSMLETGGWGLATNSVKLDITGDLRGNDVVLGRVWLEDVSRQNKSIFDICFEFRRKIKGDQYERVAFCKQRTSWIKVTGHGEGVLGDLPEEIKNYMESVGPRINDIKGLDQLPEPYKVLSIGDTVKDFSTNKKFLMDYIFDTTLENSNLVGNIYFSNYAKWLGAVEDLYFYKIIPEYYRGVGTDGEFVCTNCEVTHLSEAMPFDRILIKMFVNSVSRNGVDLFFEFYLNSSNKKQMRKLAVAKQTIVWVKRIKNNIESFKLPSQITNKLCN